MTIKMTMDGQVFEVEEGMTILEAARANGVHIPTLCYMKEIDPHASCRMCVVEVEGARTFMPSCATKVREGMVVNTNTEAVRANRKRTLEMIMAHHPVDCHHCLRIGSSKEQDLDPKFCEWCFWCDCVKDGVCELQALNREYHVDKLPFTVEGYRYEVDDSLQSIVRDANKCVKCRKCVDVCNDVQCVHNLALFGRGQEFKVTPSMNKPMDQSLCVRCGRCVDVCPTGALSMKSHIDKMLFNTHSYSTKTIGMVTSGLVSDFVELDKIEKGTITTQNFVGALKKLGVDCVISEEEIIQANMKEAEQIIKNATAPIIISNSSAAKNFVELYYPNVNVTYYNSVQEQFGKCAKELASKYGWDRMKTVVFTDNNENGVEAHEKGTVDFSLSALEVHRTFKRAGVNICRVIPQDALRFSLDEKFVYAPVTKPVEFNYESTPEVLKIDGKCIAIAHNLGQTKTLLDGVVNNNNPYDVIRICA